MAAIISQIVECNALPTLILMLRSEDAAIHYEAVIEFFHMTFILAPIGTHTYMEFQNVLPCWMCYQMTYHGLQVGVIGNLVHSSPNIKKEVLAAGALQPVIGLLRYIRSDNVILSNISLHGHRILFFFCIYYFLLHVTWFFLFTFLFQRLKVYL